jgi:hypothetical protein
VTCSCNVLILEDVPVNDVCLNSPWHFFFYSYCVTLYLGYLLFIVFTLLYNFYYFLLTTNVLDHLTGEVIIKVLAKCYELKKQQKQHEYTVYD